MDYFWNLIFTPSPPLDQDEAAHNLNEAEVEKDGPIEVPEPNSDEVKDGIVVTGPIEQFGDGESEHDDTARFDNGTNLDNNIEEIGVTTKVPFMSNPFMKNLYRLLVISVLFLVLLFFFMSPETFLLCLIACLIPLVCARFFNYVNPQRLKSTRLIKWTLDEFSKEMKEFVFTSPTLESKSGSWVMAFRQTADEEIGFGLIAKNLGADVINVVANIQISIRIAEHELVPDAFRFVHKFECDGDCGFSPRIPINYEQLMGRKLEINCRICFTRHELSQQQKEAKARHERNRNPNQTRGFCSLFEDFKRGFKKGVSMAKPETDSNDLIVITGCTGESEHDLLRFENVSHFDCTDGKWLAAAVIRFLGCFMALWTAVFLTGSLFLVFHKMTGEAGVSFFLCLICTLIAHYFLEYPWTIISTRVIKWTLDEFSKEMRGYCFTSPTIHDKSGSWGLVFRQVSDEKADFGLIATEIGEGIEHVVANIEISTKIRGQNTVPGMNDIIKFVQKFEREGDCGYSTPIPLSLEELKNNCLEIKCRIRFTRKKSFSNKIWEKSLYDELKSPFIYSMNACRRFAEYLKCPATPQISENGVILPQTKFQSEMLSLTGTELEGDSLSFMKHSDTKVFSWKIPNFSKHLKDVEFWEILSPKLLVGSHGFCSIWRLHLVELEGVFRIHMQLQGLPREISKIKMRYFVELMDNCGEFVAPNNCGSTIKYPEYLHLNDTNCSLPLNYREAILERFLDKDDTFKLRISLHCEPKDTVQNLGQPTENAIQTRGDKIMPVPCSDFTNLNDILLYSQ